MMRKKLIAFLLVSIVVSSIFFISTGKMTTAEECNDCDPISTDPGDADYSKINCTCDPYEPMTLDVVYDPSYPGTIKCGYNITINVVGGCSAFSGVVSGNGYALAKVGEREFSLSCTSGTCGDETEQTGAVAAITVTDSCGGEGEIVIRNTEGKWASSGVEQSCPFEAPVAADSFYNVGGGWGAYAIDDQYKVTMVFNDPNNCSALGGCGSSGCCYNYLTEEQLDPLPCILTSHTYVSVDPCECTYNWVSSGECVQPMSIAVEKWVCQ